MSDFHSPMMLYMDQADLCITGTFTLLAYTNDSPDVAIPATWGDADPHLIDRGKVEQVRLRSFSTNVHSLEVCLGFQITFISGAEVRFRLWWHIG